MRADVAPAAAGRPEAPLRLLAEEREHEVAEGAARVVAERRLVEEDVGELLARGFGVERAAPVDHLEPVSKKPLQLRFNMTLYELMRATFVSRSRELVQR